MMGRKVGAAAVNGWVPVIHSYPPRTRRLGLQQRQFDACLDSGRHAELVQSDFNEGQRAGVTGTPALFVNGVQVPVGAVPFEVVAEAIRKELASFSS